MYRVPTDTRKILSEKRLETLQKKSRVNLNYWGKIRVHYKCVFFFVKMAKISSFNNVGLQIFAKGVFTSCYFREQFNYVWAIFLKIMGK